MGVSGKIDSLVGVSGRECRKSLINFSVGVSGRRECIGSSLVGVIERNRG